MSESLAQMEDFQYRTLFNAIDEGFCICQMLVDAHGKPYDYRFLDVNHLFEDHTGLKNAVGKTALELVPNLEQHWIDVYGSVAVNRVPTRFTQGSEAMGRWFDVYAFPFDDPSKYLFGILFKNITQTKLTQEALRESEARYRLLADAMPQLVWTATSDGSVDYYNRRASEYSGLSADSDGSWNWSLIIHLEDQARTRAAWDSAVAHGRTYECEHRLKMADGSFRWHISRAQPAVVGDLIRWYGTSTDTHEAKQNEAALRLSEQEYQRAYAAEQTAHKTLLQFLGVATHELRSPLTVIRGFTSTLLAEDVTWDAERQREFIEIIDVEAKRLEDRIRDLLDITRSQTGNLTIEPAKTSAVDILNEVRPQLDALTARHELRVQTADDLPPVHADPQRIGQVIVNLIDNAAKFSPAGSCIEITAQQIPDFVQISVEDEGPGIPANMREAIFQPFRQAAEGLVRKQGLGLGLAIIKGIIEAHGGSVMVDGEVGAGTRMIFTLPIVT